MMPESGGRPMQETPVLRVEQAEILKVLYPWYKEEVYRRREQMMRLTVFAGTVLMLILVALLLAPRDPSADPATVVFALTGIALFSSILAYLIMQQRDRHRLAKQTLIQIEQVLGLYDKGFYAAGKSLYPQDWQTAWRGDRSVSVYLTVLFALTVMVIAAILARS